jgi:hypothetical protein
MHHLPSWTDYADDDERLAHARTKREARRFKAVIWTLAGLGATALVIACFGEARAHGWYTGKHDPDTTISCCGGTDCKEVADAEVDEVPGGYRYIPTGEFIPMSRVQQSEDWRFHRCEFLASFTYRGEQMEKGKTRCFFAPPGSM